MGYRSNIGLVLSKHGFESLNRKLQELNENENNSVNWLLRQAIHHYHHKESGAAVWYWEYVKWYPEYIDVSFLERFMDSLNWDTFYFIRIGEEYEDIEIKGGFYNNPFALTLERKISLS